MIRGPPEALGEAGLGAGKAERICPSSEWEARGRAGEGAAAWGWGAQAQPPSWILIWEAGVYTGLLGDPRKHRASGSWTGLLGTCTLGLASSCFQASHTGPPSPVSRDTVRVRRGHVLTDGKLSDRKHCQQLPQVEHGLRRRGEQRGTPIPPPPHACMGAHAHTHTVPGSTWTLEEALRKAEPLCMSKRDRGREKG